MIPYYLLVFIPFIVYFFGLYNGKKYNKFCISSFFIILLLLLSMRSIKTGTDLETYYGSFKIISNLSLKTIMTYSQNGEFLYYFLSKLVFLMHGNFQLLLFICAILSIGPVFMLYYKKSDNCLLTIALFLTVSPFMMFFSGLRQSLSMGILIIAFKFIQERKLFKYLLIIFIASMFHRSAIFCCILYPLYHVKITKNWLYFIVPLMLAVFAFRAKIFAFIIQFGGLYSDRYNDLGSNGAYSILILLLLFGFYSFFFPHKNKIDKELIGLRNILLLAIFVQFFASINPIIMRLNYYNLLFIPILIPKVKKYCTSLNKRTINLAEIIMILFFVFYFFFEAYTGSDTLNIFPYIPYWEVYI